MNPRGHKANRLPVIAVKWIIDIKYIQVLYVDGINLLALGS